MRLRRVVIPAALVLTAVFAVYLWLLYGQLKDAFTRQDQFIPTRIYSDVTRIAPPQTRGWIEDRLKSLAYPAQSAEDRIEFTVRPMDYPIYLIPDGHPTIEAINQPVVLHFSAADRDSPLQSIELRGSEIPELFLEPELVATLSRSGTTAKREIRALIKFNEIPAQVWQSIIAIEDQHFLDHSGLDPRGIARAIWVNLKTFSFAQGGSTITQQLVKNLMARRTKNLFRKTNELFLALLLESAFDKEKILERYLNEVYLGQVGSFEVHGVAEGAKHFFGKDLADLNLAEVALMAGLIRGPGFYSPYKYKERAIERQRLVLKKMVETGQIAEGEMNAALEMPIRLAPPQNVANKAPYFTDFVKAELIRQLKSRMTEQEISEAGLRVYTTLDLSLNQFAQQSVSQGIGDLEKRLGIGQDKKLEGALASVDHTNGFIRALVGGRSYAQSTFNRILNMKRQVGSTFKPIVYLAALKKGFDANGVPYGPAHPVYDGPWTLTYDRGRQTWSPRNYEKEYRGWITYRTALAHSINTATAKLGWEVGLPGVIETARALGIQSELPQVPSLSLGVAELSPIELLKVYATFANHGIQDELTVIRAITQEDGTNFARFIYHPKQVFDSAAVDLLTDMLTSIFVEGTARDAVRMGFDRPAAGKTGTTSDHRDAWFAGYTPQLTTVVWVGMDQAQLGERLPDAKEKGKTKRKVQLTGASSALPIWIQYMKNALSGEAPISFAVNSEHVSLPTDIHSGLRATMDCPAQQVVSEKFLKAFEPRTLDCAMQWPKFETKTEAN